MRYSTKHMGWQLTDLMLPTLGPLYTLQLHLHVIINQSRLHNAATSTMLAVIGTEQHALQLAAALIFDSNTGKYNSACTQH